MRILLDTHCWLWLQTEPERLAEEALGIVEDRANELLFSAASSWEIAIKNAIGRLPLPQPPSTYVPSRIESSGVVPLAIEHSHALRVAELPKHHRDPFDRLLVAQAQVERVPILTADPQLEPYDVEIRWARRRPQPRPGEGVDRTVIRELLRLTPEERLRRAAREARNLEALEEETRRVRTSESDDIAATLATALGRQPGVAAAYLYGSVARGRFTSISDVDVAVLFQSDMDFDARRTLASRIAGDLSRALPEVAFDMRDLEELPLAAQGRVLTEGRLLVSNDAPRRVAIEVAIRQRYFDFLPVQERLASEGLRAMREKIGDG